MEGRSELGNQERHDTRTIKLDEDEFFRQVTMRICGSLDIGDALWQSHLYLKKFFPLDEMFLDIWDRENSEIRRVACSTSAQGGVSKLRIPIPEKVMKLVEKETISNSERIYYNSEQSELGKLIAPYVGLHNVSDLCLTLKIENQHLGGLIFRAKGQHQYNAEHGRLISLIHDPFAVAMANALTHREALELKDQLTEENQFLNEELEKLSGEVIGADGGLSHVMEMVHQVAPLSNTLLLLGETGVGKEVVASVIHRTSSRKDGPFIKVNCGAIPESLIDSELFGHEKGAFTGAIAQRRGHFERAQGGTLFLDEIGELPPAVQARLLRVLQFKEIERVGGTRTIPVNIRIIAATHRNLEAMVAGNRFREDLWFRLNVFPIIIPPLRQRRNDIPQLVEHFREKKTLELGIGEAPPVDSAALQRLSRHHWPGNVRELENLMERELIRCQGASLNFYDLPELEESVPYLDEQLISLAQAEAGHIERALEYCGGKVHGSGGAADILGLNPSTLRNRMNKLGIRYGRERAKDREFREVDRQRG